MMTTIRQTFFSDAELKDRLDPTTLIETIDCARRDYASHKQTLAQFDLNGIRAAKDAADEAESIIAHEVVNEINDGGKPAFSNEQQRKAEIKRRLTENADYQKAREVVKTMERRRLDLDQCCELARIAVDRACNEYTAWVKIADIISGLSRERTEHIHVTKIKMEE
jgi:hypothetical protein